MSANLLIGEEGLKGGESPEFKVFFEKYYEEFYSLANHIIDDDHFAHDIASQGFVKLWEKGVQALEDEGYVRGFLKRTTVNLCIDHLRKLNNDRTDYPKYIPYEQMDEAADRDMIRHDVIKVLHPLIEELPEKRKQVIKKLYLDQMTAKEVAEEMKLDVQTVHNHKYLALKQLDKEAPLDARKLLGYLIILPMLYNN